MKAPVMVFVACAAALTASPSFADARGEAKSQVEFGINVAQRGLWREAIYRWEKAVELDPTSAEQRLRAELRQDLLRLPGCALRDGSFREEHHRVDRREGQVERHIHLSPRLERAPVGGGGEPYPRQQAVGCGVVTRLNRRRPTRRRPS